MCTKEDRKREFADAFMQLIVDTPRNRRVNVVDITTYVGCERKTFYYYFENIDDLIIWIFRHNLKTMLETHFAEYPLIKPDPSLQDRYGDWPFYVQIKGANHTLEQGAYFKLSTYHWEDNRAYYENILHNHERGYCNLFNYLVNLYIPALKSDLVYLLNGRRIPADVLNFLAEYHVMGIFGRFQWHFATTRKFIMQNDLDPFWNYAHTEMKHTVDCMFDPKSPYYKKNCAPESVRRHGELL